MIRLARLGLRLTRGAGRGGAARLVLMATGSALAAVVVLTAVALGGLADRQSRTEATIAPRYATNLDVALLAGSTADGWYKRELSRVVLATTRAGAPVPPGIPRLPRPGEVFLSPALARLMAREPLVEQRFPQRRAGTIDASGLVAPDQLVAYVGVRPDEIPHPQGIAGWGDPEAGSDLSSRAARNIGFLVLITLVAPVMMFVATCARLSATARGQRLAALRLLGLSPRATQFVNAIECGLAASIGCAVGLVAWLAWRRAVPEVHIGSFAWYSRDLRLAPAFGALALLTLILLALLVGALGARRATRHPLRVRRERSARRVSPWRAAPLCTGIVLLAWSRANASGDSDAMARWLLPFGSGLLLTAVGLVVAMPVIAVATGRILRRSQHAAAVLAGARLRHEPAVASRLVATLSLALFAAGFAQVVLTDVSAANDSAQRSPVAPAVLAGGVPANAPALLQVYGPPMTPNDLRGLSDLGIVLPKWDLGLGVDVVAATCVELRAITSGRLPSCVEGRVYRGSSPVSDVDVATVEAVVRAAGLPRVSGALALRYAIPDGWNSFGIVVPPSLAPPTTREALIAVSEEHYRPQVLTAGLAGRFPGATFNPLITYVDRLDSVRIYTGIVALGTTVALLVGLAALVVASVDRALERRAALAHLAALGTPARTIRSSLVLQTLPTAVLLLGTSALAAVLGGSSYLRWGDPTLDVPIGRLAILTAVAIAMAVVATVASIIGTVTKTRPELLRSE